jgi:hypothetical protein
MDTSADRGRVRLAGAEDVLHNEGYQREQQRRSTQMDQQLNMTPAGPPTRPPFPPRQGYFQQREKRDMTKVQCFNCQGFGHISHYCTQGRALRTRDVLGHRKQELSLQKKQEPPPSNEPIAGYKE